MELKDTIGYMCSEDYQDRFIAEYWQLKIRHDKLKIFIQKIEIAEEYYDGNNMPVHDCPLQLLKDQLYYMDALLDILDKRRIIEDITI